VLAYWAVITTASARSRWTALKSATFPLGKTAPDSEALIVSEGVFKAFSAYLTGETDPLCFTG
jgi:hypothetical protein